MAGMSDYLATAAAQLATLSQNGTALTSTAGCTQLLTIVMNLVQHAQIVLPDTNSGLKDASTAADIKGSTVNQQQVLY